MRVASAGSSRAVTAAWYAARKEEADFKEQFLKLEEIERRFGLAQIKSSGSPYSVDRNISAGLTTGMQLAWDFIQVALDNLPDGLTEELSRILVHRKTRHTLLQLASISVPELLLFRDYLKGGSPRLVVREGSLQLSEGINLDRQGWDAWNTQPIVLGCPALHSKGGVSNVILELWELCIKIYSAYQELQSVALRTRVQMKICFLETGEPEINQILRKKSTRPGTEGHSLTRKS